LALEHEIQQARALEAMTTLLLPRLSMPASSTLKRELRRSSDGIDSARNSFDLESITWHDPRASPAQEPAWQSGCLGAAGGREISQGQGSKERRQDESWSRVCLSQVCQDVFSRGDCQERRKPERRMSLPERDQPEECSDMQQAAFKLADRYVGGLERLKQEQKAWRDKQVRRRSKEIQARAASLPPEDESDIFCASPISKVAFRPPQQSMRRQPSKPGPPSMTAATGAAVIGMGRRTLRIRSEERASQEEAIAKCMEAEKVTALQGQWVDGRSASYFMETLEKGLDNLKLGASDGGSPSSVPAMLSPILPADLPPQVARAPRRKYQRRASAPPPELFHEEFGTVLQNQPDALLPQPEPVTEEGKHGELTRVEPFLRVRFIFEETWLSLAAGQSLFGRIPGP